jgi:hypothetical protein
MHVYYLSLFYIRNVHFQTTLYQCDIKSFYGVNIPIRRSNPMAPILASFISGLILSATTFTTVYGVLSNSALLSSSVLGPQVGLPTYPDVMASTGGLFAQPTSLLSSTSAIPFSCSGISIFKPNLSVLASNIPGFPTGLNQTCNPASLGPAADASCKWVPQTFLGMLYDRGIEMMRHNISENDSFQVLVS